MPFASPKPLVMMLAGLPAAGKSTELREALRTGRPLFGTDVDHAFRRLHPPPHDAENDLPLEERLNNGHWIHEVDLFRLDLHGRACASLVVHFDLFWYLWGGRRWIRELDALASEADLASFLRDEHRIGRAFRHVFTLRPLRGARVLVQVQKPPYETACARSRERDAGTPAARFQLRHLYDGSTQGHRTYDRIYAAWQLATTRPWELDSTPGLLRSRFESERR